MNFPIPQRPRSSPTRQRGAAAVELALIIPILLVLLSFPLFFARYFWHYTVAQKAAQDAARYLSTVSHVEMRVGKLAQAAAAVASDIATAELAELNPGPNPPQVVIQCGTVPCLGVGGTALPQTVRVQVSMDMFDDIFGAVDTGQYGMRISADVVMRYVGN
jgi:Flp pilus assembly protein TadG